LFFGHSSASEKKTPQETRPAGLSLMFRFVFVIRRLDQLFHQSFGLSEVLGNPGMRAAIVSVLPLPGMATTEAVPNMNFAACFCFAFN